MKRRRVMQVVSLGGLALPLAGCTNDVAEDTDDPEGTGGADNGTDTDSGDDTGNETDEDGGPATESGQQEFSGSGESLTDDFAIEGGLTIVDATHDGDGDFGVRLMPEDGGEGTIFADSSGTYNGQTAMHMTSGSYRLSVVAGGDWEVVVQQPRDTSGETPPLSFSGSGNEVHGPFEFDGTYRPSGENDGERISVNLLSSTSDSREFLFHHDSIRNPSSFESHDVGYIEVKSDGEWSVEIE
ncbi:hypothetical protein [Natrinema halophilum]|uniref:Uncharacterized protein n=1 Tax=Natrinema halophilum TaxID=1699371 RepID=A0A7D5KE42_9EURY|nr:hypothetical protein [Natrinema halophilum]QLG49876.1 hypothetical protein HYG82_13930 [Natrinema halophilum]